ncbi:MAG: PliI family lysozyme inhibitor of I-type lysozyme [Planctomycetota bacterium]
MKKATILSLLACICLASVSANTWAAEPFKKALDLQGFSFFVEATNEGSINQLKITPSGLTKDNTPAASEIEGTVSGAEIGDLDANGFPEVYVFVTSAGSGSYGSLVAYAVNNGKSMTPIYLPPITDDAKASKGYMGHDEFAVLENVLGRRFPIYKEGDTNSDPSGKTRQLQYKLVPGEAGWVLQLKDITEF